MALTLLIWAAVLGPTAAGVVLALRALPWVQKAIMARTKPWACDICMGFWTTGILALGLGAYDMKLLLVAGPAYPFALWILRKLQEPAALPPLEE